MRGMELGRSIAETAAQTFALTTRELGGKGVVILFDDMDIDQTSIAR